MDLRDNVSQINAPYMREERHHDHHQMFDSASATAESERSLENGCSSGMTMYFHFTEVETILFKFWHTDSGLAIVLSCLVVFIVAVLYELLKFYREWLKKRERRRLKGGALRRRRRRSSRNRTATSAQPTPATSDRPTTSVRSVSQSSRTLSVFSFDARSEVDSIDEPLPWLSAMHVYQTFLHMLQVTISFMLMLVFMTFNVWLCLAVVLGAGVGYFLFLRSENISEHCN